MTVGKLIEQGNICLDEREDIPSAPLWHIGKVAIFESQDSFDLLQNTIDYLTCKGKLGKSFTDNEKEFMKEIFEALWWGGQYYGYKEAAVLANHYVNGNGKTLNIDSGVYRDSAIVKDTMLALKAYIKEQAYRNKPISMVKSNNPEFLRTVHAGNLKQGKRSVRLQGYLLGNGALLVEQSNQRLKNADHRFYLNVNSTRNGSRFLSQWKVESIYDFEPFEKELVTDIPLAKGFTLKLPDGLSQYLTKIGVAQDFKYISAWQEIWA